MKADVLNLPPLIQTFVLHFGEMGSRWGLNRTVGQIYALLYLSEQALNADQVVAALGFSRSSVSTGVKELTAMNLLMLQHKPGDRKDYYATHSDIWEVVRTMVEVRRQREIAPTVTLLKQLIAEKPSGPQEQQAQAKMTEMHDLLDMLTHWYQDMQKIETEKLIKLLNMGSKIYQLSQKTSFFNKGGNV